MAFDLNGNKLAFTYLIIIIVLLPLTIIAVILRFVANRRAGRKAGLEDWLALLALFFYILGDILAFIGLALTHGRSLVTLVVLYSEDFATIRKYTLAGLYAFIYQQSFSKFSIMALYHRIFGINRTYSLCIYGVAIAQVLWTIGFTVAQSFQCQPIDKFYYPLHDGTCVDESIMVIGGETPNSFLDFCLVVLAMVMIRHLNMPKGTRLKLAILFGLGSLAAIIGFVKIAIVVTQDVTYSFSVIGIWAHVQQTVGVICCCAPVYKPIMPESVWSWVSSTVSLSRWRTRSGSGSTAGASSKNISGRGRGITDFQSENKGSQSSRVGWVQLDESSTNMPAWPTETHGAEARVVGAENDQMVELGTIQVVKSVDVV